MSFDDFANHIYQKHRLAVALAIIRSKPANVRTDKYLEDVKSKINHKMGDDNFSVCSEDFLMEDEDEKNDSVTILKDFNPEFVINDDNLLGDDNAGREKPISIPENLSQITYYDSSQTEFPANITDIMLSQDNYIINQKSNIELTIPNNFGSEEFNDRKRIVDQNTIIEENSTYETYSKENNNETAGSNYKAVATSTESTDETYYDSQKTQLYTVHGFTQNYTHYSPSQNDIVIPNKYLYGDNKNKKVSSVPNKDINEENNTAVVNDFDNETQFASKENRSNSKVDEQPTNREEFEYIQTMNMFSQNNDNNFNEIQYNKVNFNSESNKTTLHSSPISIPENLSQITYYDSSQTEFPANITDIMLSQDNYIINQKSNIELTIPNNFGSEEFNDRKRIVDQNTIIEENSTYETYSKENNNETAGSNYKAVATSTESTDETYYDSQKTQLYTVHGFTQNYTHYSPSQNDIVIPNKYLYGDNKNKKVSSVPNKDINEENNTAVVNDFDNETQFASKENRSNSKVDEQPTNREEFEYIQTMNMFSQNNDNNFNEIQYNKVNFNSESNKTMTDNNIIINKDTESNNIQNTTQFSQNFNQYFDEIQNIEGNDTRNSFPTQNDMNKNGGNSEVTNMEITDETLRFSQNIDNLSQNRQINDSKNKFEKAMDKSKPNYINQLTNESNTENITQSSDKDYQLATIASGNDSSHQTIERRDEEDFDSEEIISYKVLEEFNKVKSFLNRQNRRMSCVGYSTDSGYRSDSQRTCNRSALQLSVNWLNQSGCCLFNYIMQCPLVTGTRDITNEIAQVLSQLIDRLHEEEQYPSFLEDLLETVDLLLRQIYEGDSSEESEFLKKDESIQRILLLNKSIHIQKHSIEKMSNILESFHSKVTETDSTHELTNIDQIENISYVFHVLEILLKNYLRNKDILSQCSTQKSQDEEKVFKRSSMTDIWRKKWNPNQQVFEGSREKKCVLKTCSEILNRIVVDCVSSYSLIAYSALKCFNSMQT